MKLIQIVCVAAVLCSAIAKLSEKDKDLIMAVRAGDVAKVESLIQDGANVNCMNTMYYDYHDESSHQYYSWSPLYHAVDAENEEMIELLLKHGADTNAQLEYYNYTPLYRALKKNNFKIANQLLKNGAKVNRQTLYHVCKNGEIEKIELLLSQDFDRTIVNQTDHFDRPILFAAVESKNPKVAELLINAGANVTEPNGFGISITPLQYAIASGAADVADVLLKHGASLNLRNRNDQSLLEEAINFRGSLFLDEKRFTGEGNREKMIEWLINRGVNVNEVDSKGRTPLFGAANMGNVKAAELLLNAGASVNVADSNGATPLHIAAANVIGYEILVSQKKYNGTSMATIINLDRYGLHRLAHEGNGKMVEFLIQKGADVNAADKSGVTPLHAAASLDWTDAVDVLIKHGANVNAKTTDNITPLSLATKDEIKELLKEGGATN